jgi:integrase
MGVKIRERFPGEWWVFITHKGNRTAKPAGELEVAEEMKQIIEREIRFGLFQFPKREAPKLIAAPRPTVREYFKAFDETHLALQRESTRLNYTTSFADIRLDEVKLEDIERLIVTMRSLTRKDGSPKLARGTIDRTMRELRAFFNHAIEHGVIEKSPVPRPKKLNPKFKAAPSRREEIDPLTEIEVPLFLETVQNDGFSRKHLTLFLVLIHAGLRIGEALALEWPDIDWLKREMIVRRTWDRDFKKLRPPKNDKIRRVPLSNALFHALQAYRGAKVQEWFRHKGPCREILERKNRWDELEHTPKPIFHSLTGDYLDADNILRRHFKRCLRKAGIRVRAQHDLRHTFASLHLSNGTPIAYVSQWMGHSTIELTVSQYGHLQPKQGHDWINSLPGLKANLQQACNNATNANMAVGGSVFSFPVSGNDFEDLVGAGDGDRTRDVQLGKTKNND